MSGTKSGGTKCAATNKKKYGADYYARIGAIGGKKGTTGGFYANRELARIAGRKGGLAKGKKTHVVILTREPSFFEKLASRMTLTRKKRA